MKNKLIWVLRDEKVGSSNQSIALAEILGQGFIVKEIQYNFLAKLPNFIKLGLVTIKNCQALLEGELPDVIIAGGRRLAQISAALKKMKPQMKIIHILNPNMKLNKFDLVLLPQHDQKLEHNHHDNILFFNGSITHIPSSKLDRAKEEWKDKINEVLLPGPRIAAIIGGNSKGCRFFVSHASDLANKLINAAQEAKGSIMVTTSRRTPELISKTIHKALESNSDKVSYFFYGSKTPGPNPYHAILANADYIIVTGDSISMACEAIESGKPTFIYEGQNMLGKKHKKFIEFLFQIKLAKRFKGYLASFIPKGFKNSELIKNEVLNKIFG